MTIDLSLFWNHMNSVLFLITLSFIALDVITGYAQAVATHTVSSSMMREGFWHKLALIFSLVAAGLLDLAANFEGKVESGLGIDAPIFAGACVFVIWMELTSILENIAKMNPELAKSPLWRLFGTGKDVMKNDEGNETGKKE